MKESEIEDHLIRFTNTETNQTIIGRINLYHTDDQPDQWRIVYTANMVEHVHMLEDVLLPYEVHKVVERVDGKLVLNWPPVA